LGRSSFSQWLLSRKNKRFLFNSMLTDCINCCNIIGKEKGHLVNMSPTSTGREILSPLWARQEVIFIHEKIEKVRESTYSFPDSEENACSKKAILDHLDVLNELLLTPANIEALSLLLSRY
jgi:hypothetical protein